MNTTIPIETKTQSVTLSVFPTEAVGVLVLIAEGLVFGVLVLIAELVVDDVLVAVALGVVVEVLVDVEVEL